MNRALLPPTAAGALLVALLAALPAAAQAPLDSTLLRDLRWREIGPFRGGRSVAVAGVPTQPHVYYFGATGGGVWKTEDAGLSWKNVSDGWFRTGSVGAVAVAESDPGVVYVGMGEHAVRGVATSHGDGVYRSNDAGRTWTHLGLDRTRHIAAVRVHPRDPELVFVAAQGALHGPSTERGVYRSRDGGRTWERVLYVDENTGAADLSMDPNNPRVLYAAMWDHRRLPWTVRSGGPGSGLFKSTDGGTTWKKLTRGLPSAMGKVGVSVSRADPDRVYAVIEADSGGVYRSDSAGEDWRRVNADRELITRAWYYNEIFADPREPETVYVLNAPMLKSTDGGRSFRRVPTPHGDNHDLWINPLDNRWMIEANDGGANVSPNGGLSWSTQQNQPTAQFYRVNTDHAFPYRVYGGQQDNSSVILSSRTADEGIDWKDWEEGPGCESAYLAFDPGAPRLVYGGCYQGIIEELDQQTGQTRNVMAYPEMGLGATPSGQRYRFNWNAPILVSRHDPRVIYHAANVLLRSTDRGRTWSPISPDLTRDEEEKQGPGGSPFTNEAAGAEIYNTIFYVAESPHDAGTLWVGTDDGLVQLTRDGGRTWTNVTPRGLPESQVNAIEASPHDAGTAYLAVTRYKFNDFTPRFYRTTDFGKSWKLITRGIPAEQWSRVVREDPARRGLLYAGTEQGAWVSWDAGERWQPLQRNLPVVPITDLKVQGTDLVASTSGRGFWILDNVEPLRQMDARVAAAGAHLLRPAPAVRTRGGAGREVRGQGRNPPNGAAIDYVLGRSPKEPATLEILDAAGRVVRRFSSASADSVRALSGAVAPPRLPARKGLNRFVWDLRHEPTPAVAGLFLNGDLGGRRVVPGTYQIRLSVDGATQTQPLQVVDDPRLRVPAEAYAQQDALLAEVDATVAAVHDAVARLRRVRDGAADLRGRAAGLDSVTAAARALEQRIDAWEATVVQPRQKTFQDVINFPNQLNAQLLYLREVVDASVPPTGQGARTRLEDLKREWATRAAERDALLREAAALNELARRHGVPAVRVG